MLDAAFGWIGDLVSALAQFIPRLQLVRATERGIKFTRSYAREAGPGLHWWWPAVTEFEIYPVVRQVKSLPEQKLQTRDGATFVVDAVMVFEISDLTKFMVENFDAEDSLQELAQGAVLNVIMTLTAEELRDPEKRDETNKRLTSEVKRSLRGFGVSVEKLRLQSCAPGQVLIHAGSPIVSLHAARTAV